MPDYASMYRKIFNAVSDAIAALQQAQRDTEEMYVSSPEPDIILLPKDDAPDDAPVND